jgi:hypothetical protein
MLTSRFLADFKRATESKWRKCSINPTVFGFQFQRGTRWNPGLSDELIAAYQDVLGVRFPRDFQTFLRSMNGNDLPTLNIYGSCGEPPRESVGVYPSNVTSAPWYFIAAVVASGSVIGSPDETW